VQKFHRENGSGLLEKLQSDSRKKIREKAEEMIETYFEG